MDLRAGVRGGTHAKCLRQGKYLTASINGPHMVQIPVADPADGAYTEWGWHDGMLTMDISGTEYVLSYSGDVFLLLSGDRSAACRLYEIG